MQRYASSLSPADELQARTAEAEARVRDTEARLTAVRERIVKGETDLKSCAAKAAELRAERAKALADGRSDSVVAKITGRIRETAEAESVATDLLMGLTAAEAEATLALEAAQTACKESITQTLQQRFYSAIDSYNAAAPAFANILRELYESGNAYAYAEFQSRSAEDRHHQRPIHPVRLFRERLGDFPIKAVVLLGQTSEGIAENSVLFSEEETRKGLSW